MSEEKLRAFMEGLEIENIDMAVKLSPDQLREIGRTMAMKTKELDRKLNMIYERTIGWKTTTLSR